MLIELRSLVAFKREFQEYDKAVDSLEMLTRIARDQFQKESEDLFLKAFLVTSNRITLDARAVKLLVRKGYYGPAWTLHAASLRTSTTIAAIHIRPDMVADFDDEGKWTHHDDPSFKKNFSEGNLKKIVSEHFGEEYEKKNSLKEIEQILHGSSYALKRWYSKIEGEMGSRTPFLLFKPFFF